MTPNIQLVIDQCFVYSSLESSLQRRRIYPETHSQGEPKWEVSIKSLPSEFRESGMEEEAERS